MIKILKQADQTLEHKHFPEKRCFSLLKVQIGCMSSDLTWKVHLISKLAFFWMRCQEQMASWNPVQHKTQEDKPLKRAEI